jgi:hypothetical protein
MIARLEGEQVNGHASHEQDNAIEHLKILLHNVARREYAEKAAVRAQR